MSDGPNVGWMINLALGVLLYKRGAVGTSNSSKRLPRVGSFESKVKEPHMNVEKHVIQCLTNCLKYDKYDRFLINVNSHSASLPLLLSMKQPYSIIYSMYEILLEVCPLTQGQRRVMSS